MTDFILLNGIFQRPFNMLLAYHVTEDLWAVLAIQRLCHNVTFLPNSAMGE